MVTRTVIPIREELSLHGEPTLDEMLSDPLVVTVMRADRVDPAKLRAMLRRLAGELGTQQHPAPLAAKTESTGSFAETPYG